MSNLFSSSHTDASRAASEREKKTVAKGTGATEAKSDVIRVTNSQMKSTFEKLAQYSNVQIDELPTSPENVREIFDNVVELISVSSRGPAASQMLAIIESVFKDKDVKPGTVGAYFTGCMKSDGFRDPSCSAICAGSMPLPVSGWEPCRYNVIHYSKGDLTLFHKPSDSQSTRAYIHVLDDTFKGFTKQQVAKLRKEGITEVSIKHYGKGDYILESAFQPLSSFEVTDPQYSQAREEKSPVHQEAPHYADHNQDDSWSSATWILLILIVIIVLVIVVFGYKYWGKQQVQKPQYVQQTSRVTTPNTFSFVESSVSRSTDSFSL